MSTSECSKTLLVIIIVRRNGRTRDGVSLQNLIWKINTTRYHTLIRLYSQNITSPYFFFTFTEASQFQKETAERSTETSWEKKVANVGHLVSWSDCPLLSWPWFYLLLVLLSGFLGMTFLSLKFPIFFLVGFLRVNSIWVIVIVLLCFMNFLSFAPICVNFDCGDGNCADLYWVVCVHVAFAARDWRIWLWVW